jgi:hypothetical protein
MAEHTIRSRPIIEIRLKGRYSLATKFPVNLPVKGDIVPKFRNMNPATRAISPRVPANMGLWYSWLDFFFSIFMWRGF